MVRELISMYQNANSQSELPNKAATAVSVIVYVGAFSAGLLGLWLLPKEEAFLRKIALFLGYGFGLPLVVGAAKLRTVGVWNGK